LCGKPGKLGEWQMKEPRVKRGLGKKKQYGTHFVGRCSLLAHAGPAVKIHFSNFSLFISVAADIVKFRPGRAGTLPFP
jgi:hypothetical protein